MKRLLVISLFIALAVQALPRPVFARTPFDNSDTKFLDDQDIYVDARHVPLEEDVSSKNAKSH